MSRFRIGFLPLVDAALPIVAHEMGFAAREGVQIELLRDSTWAAVRDRLSYGQTDAAHLVAPLTIAMALGLDRPAVPVVAPFILGLNGNAVTVASRLARDIGMGLGTDMTALGAQLARVAHARRDAGARLRLAVVHRYSSHNYILRYWLAACGIDPDRDVEIMVVPPPAIADAFAQDEVDASCVGEPWNSVAVERGDAVILTTTSQIWSRGVEKLLALRADLLDHRQDEVHALLRALHAAGATIADPAARESVVDLLSHDAYLGEVGRLAGRALSGALIPERGGAVHHVADFLVQHREAANFPWRSQAMWLYSQMARWGHAPGDDAGFAAAAGVFRPDVYRAALAGTGAVLPGASAKVEGAIDAPLAVASQSGRLVLGPDRFFDGRAFDPEHPGAYLSGLPKF